MRRRFFYLTDIQGLKKAKRMGKVVLIVLIWVSDTFPHFNISGKVHDGFDSVKLDLIHNEVNVFGGTTNNRRSFIHGLLMALGEIIQNHDLMPVIAELSDRVTTDVSGTAGNEDFHLRLLGKGVNTELRPLRYVIREAISGEIE